MSRGEFQLRMGVSTADAGVTKAAAPAILLHVQPGGSRFANWANGWLATALVDIEPRLRRVIGYRHLPKLREALKRELKIETKTSTVSKKKAA